MDEVEDGMAVAYELTDDDIENRLNDADACIAQLEEKVAALEATVSRLTDAMQAAGLLD
jgi:uncharacterized protein YceH (UPF0502 family)